MGNTPSNVSRTEPRKDDIRNFTPPQDTNATTSQSTVNTSGSTQIQRPPLLTDSQIQDLGRDFHGSDGNDSMTAQLETLRRTKRDKMPPPSIHLKQKPYPKLVNDRLIPIGDHIMKLVKGRLDWAFHEMLLWKYVGQLYWPIETDVHPHLRAREMYYNHQYRKHGGMPPPQHRPDQRRPSTQNENMKREHEGMPPPQHKPDQRRPSIQRDNMKREPIKIKSLRLMMPQPSESLSAPSTIFPPEPQPVIPLSQIRSLPSQQPSTEGSPGKKLRLSIHLNSQPVSQEVVDSYAPQCLDDFIHFAYQFCIERGRNGDAFSDRMADIYSYNKIQAQILLEHYDQPLGRHTFGSVYDLREDMELKQMQREFNEEQLLQGGEELCNRKRRWRKDSGGALFEGVGGGSGLPLFGRVTTREAGEIGGVAVSDGGGKEEELVMDIKLDDEAGKGDGEEEQEKVVATVEPIDNPEEFWGEDDAERDWDEDTDTDEKGEPMDLDSEDD
ncbi:hypothetical protein B0J11DRAFT_589741 [Dendryphion nanum]|uniref:Uncharacterized protein n=1 Tax=Dendryphion nanum TaxID=256645 RepID=A0A9P9DL14_9PLEO|nr:hypothetical protein B0J11DRAFT_589741 [Dendryphion nanum]